MYYIILNDLIPYINLATEEYFFKNFDSDFFILYRNSPSVIVGKHQNALAEIDYNYANNNGIEVLRRISGGGAVYHDEGNINFAYISTCNQLNTLNFATFVNIIVDILNKFGAPVYADRNNNMLISGLKISGNAQHIYKNRVLQHGTLLFNSNLTHLYHVLTPTQNRYTHKGVKSKFAHVMNLASVLPRFYDENYLMNFIINQIIKNHNNALAYNLSIDDKEKIFNILSERYINWQWNYAYSPNYTLNAEISELEATFQLTAQKGIIKQLSFNTQNLLMDELKHIAETLCNHPHQYDPIIELLYHMKPIWLPQKISLEKFAHCLF